MRKLQIGSCFSGIGGLELGLEATGFFETKWQVEIEDFPTKVLEKHWPDVKRWRDVKTFPPEGDWSCDILVGGFPCQDISIAGKGGGLTGERSGLFYELLRIIDLIRPDWILLENVPAILHRGADEVFRSLAEIGLRDDNPHFRRMESHCFPASSVGAPHKRERFFLLAHANLSGLQGYREMDKPRAICRQETLSVFFSRNRKGFWANEPSVPRISNGFPKRMDRITAIGNAVVPQVAEYLGSEIVSYINDCSKET